MIDFDAMSDEQLRAGYEHHRKTMEDIDAQYPGVRSVWKGDEANMAKAWMMLHADALKQRGITV